VACSLVSRESLKSGANSHRKTFTNFKFSYSVTVHEQISELNVVIHGIRSFNFTSLSPSWCTILVSNISSRTM